MRFSHSTRNAIGAFILFLAPMVGTGQQDEAAVRGIVVDEMGASIPRAKISIANRSTKRELTSDEMGEFSSSVPAGVYQITIESPGFKIAKLNRVRLQPRLSKTLRIALKVRPLKYGKCPKGQTCIWL